MSNIPQISGDRLIRALERAGFAQRKGKGGHRLLVHAKDLRRRAVVPVHGDKPIKPGTLMSILEGAGLTLDELKRLL
jgi:predicted RNA binding protein YcfA (HicA-like mRNA interferase family)